MNGIPLIPKKRRRDLGNQETASQHSLKPIHVQYVQEGQEVTEKVSLTKREEFGVSLSSYLRQRNHMPSEGNENRFNSEETSPIPVTRVAVRQPASFVYQSRSVSMLGSPEKEEVELRFNEQNVPTLYRGPTKRSGNSLELKQHLKHFSGVIINGGIRNRDVSGREKDVTVRKRPHKYIFPSLVGPSPILQVEKGEKSRSPEPKTMLPILGLDMERGVMRASVHLQRVHSNRRFNIFRNQLTRKQTDDNFKKELFKDK